jgi:hypothetical protein
VKVRRVPASKYGYDDSYSGDAVFGVQLGWEGMKIYYVLEQQDENGSWQLVESGST